MRFDMPSELPCVLTIAAPRANVIHNLNWPDPMLGYIIQLCPCYVVLSFTYDALILVEPPTHLSPQKMVAPLHVRPWAPARLQNSSFGQPQTRMRYLNPKVPILTSYISSKFKGRWMVTSLKGCWMDTRKKMLVYICGYWQPAFPSTFPYSSGFRSGTCLFHHTSLTQDGLCPVPRRCGELRLGLSTLVKLANMVNMW